MKNRISSILLVLFISILLSPLFGQIYSNKEVGKKNETYIDSLKKSPYPYILPIWGAKATARGFNLPYSAGISLNYFGQESDLIIEDLFVGFNNGPMYDLNEIIRFNNAVSTANSINLRPDIWILPFLNVYGVFSKAHTSTEINAGLWIPDANNEWSEIMSFSSKAEFDVTGMGFGLTPTLGVGGGWIALDMNFTWQDVSALDKPVFTFVFGPRIGKTIAFKKPDRNIAFWAGGFRVNLSAETKGNIALSEVIETDGLQEKVDQGIARVDEAQVNVDYWWNNLTAQEQMLPSNKAKYNTANRAIDKSGEVLNNIDGALNDEESATVQYSLNKRPKDMWNFIIGTQFQLNKHYMLRAEYGFLGSRQQFMTSLQYRFGL